MIVACNISSTVYYVIADIYILDTLVTRSIGLLVYDLTL